MQSCAEDIIGAEPIVIAHRGYSAIAPENTLAAFALALRHGAELVELDCYDSKDGVPMVFHDRNLDRTTDVRKKCKRRRLKICDRESDELQTLDAGSWFDASFAGQRIPTLAEALSLICSQSMAVVEHKAGDAKTLAKTLRAGNWLNRVVVISFDWKFLRDLHELEPKVMLGALGPPARLTNGRRPIHVRRGLAARLKELKKTGAKVAVWNRRLSSRGVRLARAQGIAVWVYTVNNARLAKRLMRMGVTGIITNEVERIRNTMP